MADADPPVPEADTLPPPPIDRVGENVAMARIQGALFGASQPPTLQRYALLAKLGEGSYGAVYSAWDPRLDRKVAIKVLHGGPSGELEREARALAKLSHPHVVAVHDVGESDGSLFLAMEFVDGTPLSALDTTGLRWRGIVGIYRQAASGLAAAHAAGIVHRDFKPANALLGRDGRVRVLDFGLARADAAASTGDGSPKRTRAAGTPRYMAPEQHRGEAVDAATDQYCFCAALWESLYRQPAFAHNSLEQLQHAKQTVPQPPDGSSTPTRVARILQRGMAPLQADRFPTMAALDAALGRTLERRTRMIAGMAIGGLALAAGIGLGRVDRPCAGADAPPSRWSADSQSSLLEAFVNTQSPHAASSHATTQTVLNAWADEWGAARQDACLRHSQGVQSAEGLDLRVGCLDRQRARFDALLDVLLAADSTAVDRAVDAASALPSPGLCRDLAALRTAHPIPEGAEGRVHEADAALARARAELEAGHHARAGELVAPVLTTCRAHLDRPLDHPPTCVEATLVAGEVASLTGAHTDALPLLREAAVEAQRAGLPTAFAQAAAGLTWELGEIAGEFDNALTWAALGKAALHEDAPIVALTLLNNEGAVLFSAGRWDEAAAAHQRPLDTLEEGSALRVRSLTNLANVNNRRGRFADAEAGYNHAIELGTKMFGATHPRVLMARQNRAGLRNRVGNVEAGRADLQEILADQRRALGDTHPELAATLVNLSIAQLTMGDAATALQNAEEATALVRAAYGDGSQIEIDTRLAEADALIALKRPAEAVDACQIATTRAEALLGAEHSTMAYAGRALGFALRANGQEAEAVVKIRAAKAHFARLGMDEEAAATVVGEVASP